MPIKNTLTNTVGVDASPFKNDVFSAEGGNITTFVSGGLFYFTHQYTASGEFVIKSAQSGITAQILVVAGGGYGGASQTQFLAGGGGGAGGLIYSASYGIAPYENNYYFDVCVGNGGAAAAGILAQTSSFAPRVPYPVEVGYPIVAAAGGFGARGGLTGSDGGSGGGACSANTTGSGIVGQGFDGTLGQLGGGINGGGGGGGASQKGQVQNGGSGSFYSFYDQTGSFFAGGGGGGGTQAGISNGFGGPGGGGNGGSPGQAGTNYLGGGGGGGLARTDSGGSNQGGNGGSGSVYITYTVPLT